MQRVHYSDEDPLSVINAGVEAAARRDGWAPLARARSPRPVRRSAARAIELMARAAWVTTAPFDRDNGDGDQASVRIPEYAQCWSLI